ncbi:MAG: hypothetical protein AAF938_08185 [Myxococcota bacterium]
MCSQTRGRVVNIRVLGLQTWDAQDDNVDVHVTFEDGSCYTATFFTIENIRSLFEKNRRTGECDSGRYLWAADMIIVRDLAIETIEQTVESLLKDDELVAAFRMVKRQER